MFSRRFALIVTPYLVAVQSVTAQDSTRVQHDSSAVRKLDVVVVVARPNRAVGYSATRSRTSTRTDTPLRDTPQAATVLTRSLIADQAMQSIADVVRYVPGVTMALGEGHRDAPTIRGQSTTADFYLNGVRDDAQYLRDLYNVERVEALKGSNAMTFGRGGGGGIINRVSKQPGWQHVGAATLEGGGYDHARATFDVNEPFGARAAARLNLLAERTGGFREHARIERQGINPVLTLLNGGTVVRAEYEHFSDERNVDRGIPSLAGAPVNTGRATFFGDPDASRSQAAVNASSVDVEHAVGTFSLRNHARFTRYDKFYQNVYPSGAVNAATARVILSGYNSATARDNLFNQTDLTGAVKTGALRHTLLIGAEFGRQRTDNFRNTAYFGSATTLSVPVDAPSGATAAVFRQNASDADNHVRVDLGAVYVQDQLALGSHVQAIAGIRTDRFFARVHDNRTGLALARVDHFVSPRVGLILKPVERASLYASFGVSHLPSSGDQFSSLTATTSTLEPERFINRELGAKWDVTPTLALSGAVFRLDRSNSSAPDPTNASRIVLTGAQRSTGMELGVSGDVTSAWQIAGGFSAQRAEIRSAITGAGAGATVPLVPHTAVSLWNKVQLHPALGVGLGAIRQTKMYAAIDNAVTLPAFTRFDGALFFNVSQYVRAQVNVENLLDTRYFATSHGNNNIMPGAPRTLRVSVNTGR